MDSGNDENKRRLSDARPEFIVLGFLYSGSTHGYDLYRQFGCHLGRVWHISQSQLYATLKRLELRSLISGAAVADVNGPERRCFALTDEGRRHFDAWLSHPSIPGARFIKLEFLTRLFFAQFLGIQSPPGLIDGQAQVVAEELQKLERAILALPEEDRFGRLGLSFRINQLRSIQSWLREEVGAEFPAPSPSIP